MKLSMPFVFLVLFFTKTQAQHHEVAANPIDSNHYKLNVLVRGLVPHKNYMLYFELLNSSRKALRQKKVLADKPELTVSFENLPKGKYAVRFFQDENVNGKLDTNIFGMPTEAWGYSNDARGLMSAPKMEDALFDLTSSKTIVINK